MATEAAPLSEALGTDAWEAIPQETGCTASESPDGTYNDYAYMQFAIYQSSDQDTSPSALESLILEGSDCPGGIDTGEETIDGITATYTWCGTELDTSESEVWLRLDDSQILIGQIIKPNFLGSFDYGTGRDWLSPVVANLVAP